MEEKIDCSYWMDGHCRFADKVCWNIHDPNKKGQSKVQETSQTVFQEGQEAPGLPPKNSSPGLENEEWINPRTRKQKKWDARQKNNQEKNWPQQKDGNLWPTVLMDGEKDQMTPSFPKAGEASQDILVQVLKTLLQQAGAGQ